MRSRASGATAMEWCPCFVDFVLGNVPDRQADPDQRAQGQADERELVLGAVQGGHGSLALFGRENLLGVPVHEVGSAEQLRRGQAVWRLDFPLSLGRSGSGGSNVTDRQGTGAPRGVPNRPVPALGRPRSGSGPQSLGSERACRTRER